jgi:DNA-binding transcriptional LysR family regulator
MFRCITSVNHDLSTIKPQWEFYQNSKIVKQDLNNVIEADSLLAQIKLILLGSGIGRMPDYFINQQLKDGRLVEIFPDIDKPSSFVYLLYPNQRVLPRKTRVFIDFVKNLSEQDKLF